MFNLSSSFLAFTDSVQRLIEVTKADSQSGIHQFLVNHRSAYSRIQGVFDYVIQVADLRSVRPDSVVLGQFCQGFKPVVGFLNHDLPLVI
ncbi:hypothetical protein ALP51_103215 [Pseudomonas savastanoi]|uniref:Uncharacterized protein n=1 Tax=Pseudomonas savastanoi TaxID=29438 RepID=A0A3M5JGK2_PSESS|nr:hypothetical protein ALP51_103215 [Pseudomonas savastanoi]